jgi:TolA-binding protein
MPRALAILLVLLAAGGAAAAHKGEADLGKKADPGGPSADLAGEVVRPKVEGAAAARPSLDYDRFRFHVELQLKEKRRELIATLQQMMKLGKDQKEKPDLLFRLAELHWEEAKYWFFEAERREGEAIACEAKNDTACARSKRTEKKTDEDRRNQFQTQAIAYYREIIASYPRFERIDVVLFFLGHNLWEGGQEKDALAIYKTLITRFPKSQYVPDAYLAFGEWYFNNSGGRRDMLGKALEAYNQAASFTESPVYGFAIYKQGWCHYNLTDYAAAADKFKAVVLYGELASSNVTGGGDNRLALVREARKDYVLAYSRFGDPLAAREVFQQVGGDEWFAMLKNLAEIYYGDGSDKESVLVYRQLIKEKPLSPEAPFFQGRVVDAVRRVGHKELTVEQARLLVKIFQDVEKAGVVRSDEDRKRIEAAHDLAERTLSNLAVTWHNEAKKTRDDDTFGFANELYRDYLTIFPEGKKGYDLRFYHAELLYENVHDWAQAAAEYDRVVAIDEERTRNKQKPGKWLTKAAEGAVFAYDQLQKKEAAQPSPAAKGSTAPLDIPPQQKATLAAYERYLRMVPDGEKQVQIGYKAAQVYYRYNHFDEAVQRFSAIALQHPESDVAEYSANLVLDVYNLLGDYATLDAWARKFMAEPRLAQGKFKADLLSIVEKNSFKLVEKLEKDGRYSEAGDRYLQFVSEYPGSDLADEALFNASVDLGKARRTEDALAVRERIFREYPKSNLAPRAMLQSAATFEEIGDLARAAAAYEAYAAGYEAQRGAVAPKGGKKGKKAAPPPPKAANGFEEEKARTAVYNAALLREGLGDVRLALAHRERYLALWPGADDAGDVLLAKAELERRSRMYAAALDTLADFETRNRRSVRQVLAAELKVARIQEAQGKGHAASETYERIWDTYRKLPGRLREEVLSDATAGEAVGEAHYRMSAAYDRELDRIQLRLPEAAMAKALKAKAQKLLELQQRYTETVGLRSPGPAICALTHIGTAYRRFARALYDAPVPPGMTDAQVDAYRSALGEQAAPVETKAQEALESAVAKSRELQVGGPCVDEALTALGEMQPDRYPQVVEAIAGMQAAPPARGGTFVTEVKPVATASGKAAAQPPPLPAASRATTASTAEKPPPPKAPPAKTRPASQEPDAEPAVAPRPTAPVEEPALPRSGEPEDGDLL